MIRKTHEVPMYPDRVCNAIAKIGYIPSAAIMDIVDNSVTAHANNILIELDLDEDKTFNNKNNITSFKIYDNGNGMLTGKILEALALGSPADYEDNSLSKYGMGLKSAGFSLGDKITVVSRQKNTFTNAFILDRDTIREEGYVVEEQNVEQHHLQLLSNYFEKAEYDSGTFIEISKCFYKDQHSMWKIVKDLVSKMGVVYYEALSREDKPLSITVRCVNTGRPDYTIQPIDMLFWDKAEDEFDPDTYTGTTPCKVINTTIDIDGSETPATIRAVIFPRDGMKKYHKFTDEERDAINHYKVGAENKGFFIYRNDRLIRWGDGLNLVGKDTLGFRATISINTSHDDALQVDVSKQRLSWPEDFLEGLKKLIKEALNASSDAFAICTDKLKETSESEGYGFSDKNKNLVEEDPDEPDDSKSKEIKQARKEKLKEAAESAEHEDKEEEAEESSVPDENVELFEKIRYSDKIRGNILHEAHSNPTEGVFIRINRRHYFYDTVLARLQDKEDIKQAFEGLLWASGVAEVKTILNLTEVDDDTIDLVLKKFKTLLAYNLEKWCDKNQDLINGDQ